MLPSGSAPLSERTQPMGIGIKADASRVHLEAYATGRPCRSPVPFFPSRKNGTQKIDRLRKQVDQAPAPPRIKQKNSLRNQRGAQTVFVFPILSVSSAYPGRPVFLGRERGVAERGWHREITMVLHSGYASNPSVLN